MTEAQRDTPAAPPHTAASPPQRWLAVAIIVYTLSICVLWLWMRWQGDRSWLATLFLFGPRWICALPLLVLVPLAAVWHRRWLGLLAISGVVIVGPILGFQVHFSSVSAPFELRVLTCNVEQRNYHVDQLAKLIGELRPEIVALQEVKGHPPQLVWPEGWHVVYQDEFLVASRYPIVEAGSAPRPTVPGKRIAVRYLIQCPNRQVQFFNLHLMTPRPGLEAVLDRKRGLDLSGILMLDAILRVREAETRLASDWVASFPDSKIVVGDFNMPVESTIYRDYWTWLDNAFSTTGFGLGFTKVTEEQGWTYGARIDQILYSPPWTCVRAWVASGIGSDHLPLVADFE